MSSSEDNKKSARNSRPRLVIAKKKTVAAKNTLKVQDFFDADPSTSYKEILATKNIVSVEKEIEDEPDVQEIHHVVDIQQQITGKPTALLTTPGKRKRIIVSLTPPPQFTAEIKYQEQEILDDEYDFNFNGPKIEEDVTSLDEEEELAVIIQLKIKIFCSDPQVEFKPFKIKMFSNQPIKAIFEQVSAKRKVPVSDIVVVWRSVSLFPTVTPSAMKITDGCVLNAYLRNHYVQLEKERLDQQALKLIDPSLFEEMIDAPLEQPLDLIVQSDNRFMIKVKSSAAIQKIRVNEDDTVADILMRFNELQPGSMCKHLLLDGEVLGEDNDVRSMGLEKGDMIDAK